MSEVLCPLMMSACVSSGNKLVDIKAVACGKDDCAWWCPGEECCGVKLIGLELIKLKGE